MSLETHTAKRSIPGKRLALTIGVNETCSSLLPPLHHSITDAQLMAEVLEQQCGFELFMPPLLGEHATSEAIRKAVRRLGRDRGNDDFLLLYFSGHGLPWRVEAGRDAVYLGSCDLDEQDVEDEEGAHVSLHWLRERLYEGTQAGRVLLILDCCFSGDISTTAPDHYLQELRQRIAYYFEASGTDSQAQSGGLRLALTATGHKSSAAEGYSSGLMTSFLLPALRGDVPEVLEVEQRGQISLQRLHRYLELVMPKEQPPSLSGDFAGRSCVLASYPERAARLRRTQVHAVGSARPKTYIPFPRNPLFQPRPDEFEQLERLLFRTGTEQRPPRIGLVGVGMVGMGGVGKTQLAIELAYRYQHRFPGGIFWMPAIGTSVFDWYRPLAELAFNTEYLPLDDDVSSPENELRRAQHFCRYLTKNSDALLILDNVEDPNLVISALPILAGEELICTILYTSRNRMVPNGATAYQVEQLTEEGSLRLLLESTRSLLLSEVLSGSQDAESCAARAICQGVGYLPLALVQLRGLLARDQNVKLARLAEVLKQRGALDIARTLFSDTTPLFAAFWLSWEKVHGEGAHRLFKLASYFPEATPIPLWLLGLAANLGENGDIFEPLGEAREQLQELSLLEALSGEKVRLHPLMREFGRRLVDEEGSDNTLLEEAGKRLVNEFSDLNKLEHRAQNAGYWVCLEQTRSALEYLELLPTGQTEQLKRVERWLDRESYLLGDRRWWPKVIPGLFFQQIYNRSVEEDIPLPAGETHARWIRQVGRVGIENHSLLRVFSGHTSWVTSVAFSPDGNKVLTGSRDKTARLWKMSSGRSLIILKGHTSWVTSVAFSPDGSKVLTGSDDQTARLWETSGKLLTVFRGHTGHIMSVAFSPDGNMVLTGSNDKKVRLWETMSGKLLTTLEGSTDYVTSAAFSPDGTKVLTASEDDLARLWETRKGRFLTRFEGHTNWVTSAAFSPDGTKALTGSADQTARLWQVKSGKPLTIIDRRSNWITSVVFSPDGSKVLTGSSDKTARLWETTSGKYLTTFEGHADAVRSVAFSADGSKALTASEDSTARLWETKSGKLLNTLKGHTDVVWSAVFSPDGSKVLTGSADGSARLWNMTNGKLLALLKDQSGAVMKVIFSPDGHLMMTCNHHGRVLFWRADRPEVGRILGVYITSYEVEAIHWQDTSHVVLSDKGGVHNYPHLYRLELEGNW